MLDDQVPFGVRIRPDELATKQPDKLVGQLEGPLRRLEDRRDDELNTETEPAAPAPPAPGPADHADAASDAPELD